jgi:hypothetical protein
MSKKVLISSASVLISLLGFLFAAPAWVNGRVNVSSSEVGTSSRDISGENFAQSDRTRTFEKPLIDGYPIDVALKGESGTDPNTARLSIFCLWKGEAFGQKI